MDRPLTEQERKDLVLLIEHILNFERNADIAISQIVERDPKFSHLHTVISNCHSHFVQAEGVFNDLRGRLLK